MSDHCGKYITLFLTVLVCSFCTEKARNTDLTVPAYELDQGTEQIYFSGKEIDLRAHRIKTHRLFFSENTCSLRISMPEFRQPQHWFLNALLQKRYADLTGIPATSLRPKEALASARNLCPDLFLVFEATVTFINTETVSIGLKTNYMGAGGNGTENSYGLTFDLPSQSELSLFHLFKNPTSMKKMITHRVTKLACRNQNDPEVCQSHINTDHCFDYGFRIFSWGLMIDLGILLHHSDGNRNIFFYREDIQPYLLSADRLRMPE